MTLERFQAIVLKLSNIMMARHYLWLNYPNDPQVLAIELGEAVLSDGPLYKELVNLGFQFKELAGLRLWVIERTDV